jgi:hypothetical protein
VIPCIGDIDVVHSNPSPDDESEIGASVDQWLAHFGCAAHQQSIDGIVIDECR